MRATRCSTSRSSPHAARTCISRLPASSASRPTPTRSRPRPRVRAFSCISRSSPRPSPTTGTRRRPSPASTGGGGRQPALLRQGAVARDAHRPVRAGDRHPAGGAEGPGSAASRGLASVDHPIFDLFEENVRYFLALLPVREAEDPAATLERDAAPGGAAPAQRDDLPLEPPDLRHLTGTAALVSGEPPATCGPDRRRHAGQRCLLLRTGRGARRGERPLWSQMSFSAAEENFLRRRAMGSRPGVYWLGVGEVPAAESRRGACCRSRTRAWTAGASTRRTATACSTTERRCATQRNAAWQSETFHRLYEDRKVERLEALREMTVRYRDHMHANEPVNEWPVT